MYRSQGQLKKEKKICKKNLCKLWKIAYRREWTRGGEKGIDQKTKDDKLECYIIIKKVHLETDTQWKKTESRKRVWGNPGASAPGQGAFVGKGKESFLLLEPLTLQSVLAPPVRAPVSVQAQPHPALQEGPSICPPNPDPSRAEGSVCRRNTKNELRCTAGLPP